jgi:hypothetical protein
MARFCCGLAEVARGVGRAGAAAPRPAADPTPLELMRTQHARPHVRACARRRRFMQPCAAHHPTPHTPTLSLTSWLASASSTSCWNWPTRSTQRSASGTSRSKLSSRAAWGEGCVPLWAARAHVCGGRRRRATHAGIGLPICLGSFRAARGPFKARVCHAVRAALAALPQPPTCLRSVSFSTVALPMCTSFDTWSVTKGMSLWGARPVGWWAAGQRDCGCWWVSGQAHWVGARAGSVGRSGGRRGGPPRRRTLIACFTRLVATTKLSLTT